MYLSFATRSTGYPQPHLEFDHIIQPQLLQFVGLLYDERDREVDRLVTLVRPDPDALITQGTFEHQGILIEEASHRGACPHDVTAWFKERARMARRLIGFNVRLDIENMKIAMSRSDDRSWEPERAIFCTMEQAASRMSLPPDAETCALGFYQSRYPTLQEASSAILGEQLDQRVDAMTQAHTSMRLFRELRKIRLVA